jgi:hypothetical protein
MRFCKWRGEAISFRPTNAERHARLRKVLGACEKVIGNAKKARERIAGFSALSFGKRLEILRRKLNRFRNG